MTNPHPNSLADLITALDKLSPSNEEAMHAIVEILGMRLESKLVEVERSEHHKEVSDSITIKNEHPTQTEPISPLIPSETSEKPAETSYPSTLIPLEKSHVDPPAWFHNPLPLKSKEDSSGSMTSYPLQTLFLPNWTRAILISALSTYNNLGSIEIDEIINRISINEPLKQIPRRPCPTMVHGVQVLIDGSEALEPFYQDQAHLKSVVRKVAGSDRTKIMEFIGCPSWGVRDAKSDDWSDYHPPSSRTTVLLITDLGILHNPYISNRVGVRDWLRFAAIVKKAGCFLVAFVPYPQVRWPKSLHSAMTIIQWDRTTSTSTIQHIVKKALEV